MERNKLKSPVVASVGLTYEELDLIHEGLWCLAHDLEQKFGRNSDEHPYGAYVLAEKIRDAMQSLDSIPGG